MGFTINQNAWNSGMRMYDDQLQRERQAVIDKRAEEEWGFKKEDREKATKKERDLNAAYEAGIAAAESSAPDTSRVNQWLSAQTGAAPQQQAQPEVPQQASVVDGAGADQTAVANNAVVQAGVPGGVAPAMPGVAAPAQKAPAAVNPERARAIQAMKLAQLTGSPQAYSQAQAQLDAVDKQAEYATIASQAMQMTPEQRQKVVGTLDMNPGYKMSASLDPKTQITTLKLEDGGEVKVSPAQLARVLVGKYKIDKGDMTGVADIEAVDTKLAERIVKDNNALRDVTSTNNQAVTQGVNIEIARNQDRRAGQAQGIQAAAARRSEEEYNRKRTQEEETKGLSMAYYMEKHPNATEAELKAVGAGIIPVVPKLDGSAPAEVKLAAAYKAAGLAKDDAEALRLATQSKGHSAEQVRQEIFSKALAATGSAEMAKKSTEEGMKYLFPQGAAPAAAVGGANGAGASIPQGAIEMLKKSPAMAAQFDQKYGAGSAAKYIKN